MSNRYRGSCIYAAYQISVHLVKQFQRRRMKKLTHQKQELPTTAMFLTDWDKMSKFYTCCLPGLFHLGKRFLKRRFFLEIDRSETRIACGGNIYKWIGMI
jgi:hypothetical protein